MKEPNVFEPQWPDGLLASEFYEIRCDDKGRNGGSWLRVMVDEQGDVYVSMQDWEDIPEGMPTPFPSIRIRTFVGGGRNVRTRQALLWLADAIRRDGNKPATDQGRNKIKPLDRMAHIVVAEMKRLMTQLDEQIRTLASQDDIDRTRIELEECRVALHLNGYIT